MTLLIVGALFPIVNPLGNAPIFLSLTQGFGSAARTMLSRKIALNGFILLVVSMLIGSHILGFFGISLPVVQVGGGLVVLATGWDLLHRREDEPDDERRAHAISATELSQQAFYPLTLPLTVGPDRSRLPYARRQPARRAADRDGPSTSRFSSVRRSSP